MKLDNAQGLLQSNMGSILSIIIALTTFLFFYAKVLTIIQKHDVDIISALIDNAIDIEDKFTADDGFFIAAALTNYNSNRTLTEDPRYGKLIFENRGWGAQSLYSIDLNSHFCTDEEMGIDRTEKTVMFPIFPTSKAEVMTYRNKFRCVDRDKMQIWGDYNSAEA